MAEDILSEMTKIHSQRDAWQFMASASTKTLETILTQILPVAKQGDPYAVVQVPPTVKLIELTRTINILRARGFRVTQEAANGAATNLKIEWFFTEKV